MLVMFKIDGVLDDSVREVIIDRDDDIIDLSSDTISSRAINNPATAIKDNGTQVPVKLDKIEISPARAYATLYLST